MPLLASELLREDSAPLAPCARSARLWWLAAAAALALSGVALRAGLGVPSTEASGGTLAFTAAFLAVLLSAVPVPYGVRAALTFTLGAGLGILGAAGVGPLGGLVVDGGVAGALARLLALVALPAALLFRAYYADYPRTPWVLAAGFLLAAPFLVVEAALALDGSAAFVSRLAAAVTALLVLCSAGAFVGQGSSGGGSVWAACLLVLLPAEVAVREFGPLADADTGHYTYPVTALGLAAAGLLAATAAFQLLAWGLGPDARRRVEKRLRGPG